MRSIRLKIWRQAVKEWMIHDSPVMRTAIAYGLYSYALALLSLNKGQKAAAVLAGVHRSALSRKVDSKIEAVFRDALNNQQRVMGRRVAEAIRSYAFLPSVSENAKKIESNPELLFGGNSIVLKSPGPNEKGVLYFFYSYTYPLFLKLSHAIEITEKYRIVLEPSWSGYCDLNILALNQLGDKVVIGYGEDRDRRFLSSTSTLLIPGDFTGNTWIDTAVFRPIPGVEKDIDVVMNAAWAWYKRHWAFFRAVRSLKDRGVVLRIALVGYPGDMSLADLKKVAEFYRVADQIEFHERISTTEVNKLYNRSYVNILWSRREGSGRALPEGMAAGVPCIARHGFNYGDGQPFIHVQSGIYSTEKELPEKIQALLRTASDYHPRRWVAENMTPSASTFKLNSLLAGIARENGERWTRDIKSKINTLNGLEYENPGDSAEFEADYDFLRSKLRRV